MANKLLGLVRSYVYLENATVKTLYTSLAGPHMGIWEHCLVPSIQKRLN